VFEGVGKLGGFDRARDLIADFACRTSGGIAATFLGRDGKAGPP
jgi:hypothetical protein